MSAIKFVNFNSKDQAQQEKYFKAYVKPAGTTYPGGVVCPKPLADFAERYLNFEVKQDDVYIMTFPKCGTTWMQEIVWVMRNSPNLDHPDSLMDPNYRIPFMDFDAIAMSTDLPPYTCLKDFNETFHRLVPNAEKVPVEEIFSTIAKHSPNPRTLKIHLPFSLAPTNLEERAKVVYVFRNAKDVCVSYYHHHVLLKWHDFHGTLEEFAEFFMKDQVMYSPFWQHMKEAWDKRNHKNVCIIFYEHLKKDPLTAFKQLNEFLETNLTTDQLEKIIDYTSFQNMKDRAAKVNPDHASHYINENSLNSGGNFFRKGKTNDWENSFGSDILTRFEEWEAKHLSTLDETFQSMYRMATN